MRGSGGSCRSSRLPWRIGLKCEAIEDNVIAHTNECKCHNVVNVAINMEEVL